MAKLADQGTQNKQQMAMMIVELGSCACCVVHTAQLTHGTVANITSNIH
jgi:hypothetical protein